MRSSTCRHSATAPASRAHPIAAWIASSRQSGHRWKTVASRRATMHTARGFTADLEQELGGVEGVAQEHGERGQQHSDSRRPHQEHDQDGAHRHDRRAHVLDLDG